jgi:hypothetical protein
MTGCSRLPLLIACFSLAASAALGQNVVDRGGEEATKPAKRILQGDIDRLLGEMPSFALPAKGERAQRVAAKLERHVADLVARHPHRPLHHTLGISGYETYFDHPNELFYALSIAARYLSPETRRRAFALLEKELIVHPPFAAKGFDRTVGAPRERYDVPDRLRATGHGEARDALGVYAFWMFVRARDDSTLVTAHWRQIVQRMKPVLEMEPTFEISKLEYKNDEAERLTGDAAGLVGFVRMARLMGDAKAADDGFAQLRRIVRLRVNLDRVNPRVIEPTSSTSAHLHAYKLARYGRLVPEVAAALVAHTDGLAVRRLAAVRTARNGWHVTLGDRWIGGENYTSPLHFGHALFAGAALVEQLDGEELLQFVDVPASAADLYFIERCALALWAAAGRPTVREPIFR